MSSPVLADLVGPPMARPEAEPAPRRPWFARPLGRLVLVIVVAMGLLTLAIGVGRAMFDAGPQYPDRWDPRVRAIVKLVERERGHRFRHPVAIYFLPPGQYTAAIVGAGGGSSTPSVPEPRIAAFQRALGLVEGAVDPSDAGDSIAGNGTLAYYDPDRKIVNVRGTKLTVGVRVTLAHELTHALQDQLYGLSKRIAATDSEGAAVLRSVLEGDAMTVEAAYIDLLDDADERRYRDEYNSAADTAESDLSEIPSPLVAAQSIVYSIGRPYVGLIERTDDGTRDPARLDRLMRDLPDVTASLFSAGAPIDDDDVVRLEAPELAGTEPFISDVVGAYSLFIMLAARIDPVAAMDAVDGWRGDALIVSEVPAAEVDDPGGATKGKVVCASARFAMTTAAEATELRVALGDWQEAMSPEARVTVDGAGSRVELRTCDPGAKATPLGSRSAVDALLYPGGRLDLVGLFLDGGADEARSWCAATAAVRQLTPVELQSSTASPELRERISTITEAALAGC